MAFESLSDATFTRDQIAIAFTHGRLGAGHVGIAFHTPKDGRQVTHLAWHRQLKVDSIPNEVEGCWACTTVQLPASASRQLVAVVRGVAKKRPQISYGIGAIAAKGSFSANGSYRPPKGSDGLTCSTFIAEVFRAACIPFVNYDTWPSGPQNDAWGDAVCQELERTGVPADHVAAVRKNIGGLRLRPYEAVGAAMLPINQRPGTYAAVQVGANAADVALRQICPPHRLAPLARLQLT
ncbi:Uncharacterised protein [Burkholderia pseudomallei]|nr:Uncharacterised protein [Burkholderia pseudomallei]CAJ3119522.1 Uncharacterised protein [Burkholderia pseudomallei]CAJ3573849.1 Uncharacterised protein [Burkholderia pseudomallei]CAJ3750032.1 Uncharacterised protein [Burkholderia pseudomallei]CAJ3990759.1 Uncharacterised protein [Burkholderia pseudomallei]